MGLITSMYIKKSRMTLSQQSELIKLFVAVATAIAAELVVVQSNIVIWLFKRV
ncbi:uncharacterized protein METZ01_LOCUS456274 [marine metagenome]|uniref:Uncharacterized protein n=1 Tax=marine metagenome TaxID=408172 RepID=A0A383A728_9ZZZZ